MVNMSARQAIKKLSKAMKALTMAIQFSVALVVVVAGDGL
jgi:formate/nitrite transporter FocA (FNT family)